jgi:hypothetical protein
MADLHAVPLARRDPREEQDLASALADLAAGRAGRARTIMAVRRLSGYRHESAEGYAEIGRAVHKAVQALQEGPD